VRKLLLVGVVLALIGIVVVVLPFGRPEPAMHGAIGDSIVVSARCSAPLVSAWRTERASGWYGYAPLTSTAMMVPSCRGKARRRLTGGALFIACGVAVGIVALRRPKQQASGATPDPAP
jgi:hypothetical protein